MQADVSGVIAELEVLAAAPWPERDIVGPPRLRGLEP